MDPVVTEAVKTKFAALAPLFDERLRRRWAAVEARSMGRGRHRLPRRRHWDVADHH